MADSGTREHVLFIVNLYPPSVGGLQQHVKSLARELVAQGHRASVVTLHHSDEDVVEAGIRVVRRRRLWGFGSVMAFPRPALRQEIINLFRNDGVTVVSTHTRFFPMTWTGHRVAQSLGVIRVHTEHGSDFVRGVSWPIALASRVVDLTVGKRTLRNADRVVGVSPAVVSFVRRLSGVDADLIFNAIEIPPAVRSRPSKHAGRRLVFLGRLVPGKGWDTLALIARELTDLRPSGAVHVDYLGDGPERVRLEKVIAELGIDATSHGYVSQAEVYRLLAGATLVNPSSLAEGFQTSLLEALAAGSGIVTAAVPGADILRDDGAPVIVIRDASIADWADAVERVESLPAYPKSKLAKWLWPHRAREYLAVVRSTRATARR